MRRTALLLCALVLVPGTARGALGGASGSRPAQSDIWTPPAGVTFQWQLQGEVDTSVVADVYDIDMFDSPKSLVAELHDAGRKVICYVSAGSYERWRPDKGDFPRRVLGKPLDGWPGERWLDIRRLEALEPIMAARVAKCAKKGFDGIEYDNVDGFTNETGFPLKRRHQLAYLDLLVEIAHAEGLAAGLKNLPQLAEELEPEWDFAVNEQCFQYEECDEYSAFIAADKAVFNVEYELKPSEFCPDATARGFTSMRKKYSLKAWRRACWEQ